MPATPSPGPALRGAALRLLTALLFTFALPACAPTDDSSEDSASKACSHDPALTYATWGEGFLDRYCTGCHASLIPVAQRDGAPESVDLETWADVVHHADRILARVNDPENPMPPGGGPTEAEKVLLAEWIACEVTASQADTSSQADASSRADSSR